MQFDSKYQFGIVILNKDANTNMVKFTLRVIAVGNPH